MQDKDNLGTRMKGYENIERKFLYRRTPVIMRLDGKAFHTFTKGCNKPFDDTIIKTMQNTTEHLIRNIQGAKVAYVQSDEISILITDYDQLETDAWFGYNVQKMVSISASMASVKFTRLWLSEFDRPANDALFDSRVFNIPKEEVINCFRWRYQDWLRNSMSMLAQSLYSHSELHGKNFQTQGKMCFEKGKNWFDLPDVHRNGTLFYWETLNDGTKRLCKTNQINLNSNDECGAIFEGYV